MQTAKQQAPQYAAVAEPRSYHVSTGGKHVLAGLPRGLSTQQQQQQQQSGRVANWDQVTAIAESQSTPAY